MTPVLRESENHDIHGSSAFFSFLRTCVKNKDLHTGTSIHADVVKRGLLEKNPFLASKIINMYAKCGAVYKAKEVFEGLPMRGVASWNSLIAGYAHEEHYKEALNCFEQMQCEGLSPDAVTYACTLKACGCIRALQNGEKLHSEIARQGLLVADSVLGVTLVDMYAKCGAFAKAKEVLEGLHNRDVVSWSALIAGYAQKEHGKEALNCLDQMQYEGIYPNAVTYVCTLKACGSIKALEKGKEIHSKIERLRLIDGHIVLGNALVDMYVKCGDLPKAKEVVMALPVRDVVSWSALLAGYVQANHCKEALHLFDEMQREGISPNAITFACMLKVCGNMKALGKGEDIHKIIIRKGLLEGNLVLGSALVDMYGKCGALAKAKEVLEGLPGLDVVSWNALLAGYIQEQQGREALKCFAQMEHVGFVPDATTLACILKACSSIGALDQGIQIHFEILRQGFLEGDAVLCGVLVDMYAKCGALSKAKEVLDGFTARDVVFWSALIAGYVQQGHAEEALTCFDEMQHEGLTADAVTFAWILKACGSLGAADRGEQIHLDINRLGLLNKNMVLANSLIDMYAKCGALAKAKEVFEWLPARDVVSWSALIAGYVQGECCEEALSTCEWMQHEGFSPDAFTFACILKACGSIGELNKGEEVHCEIIQLGLLSGNVVLGNALVDMYAKCGAFSKAKEVLDRLTNQSAISWNALIAGYVQGELEKEALNCLELMQGKGLSPDVVTFTSLLKACGGIGALDKGEEIHVGIVRRGLLARNAVLGGALVDMYAKCGAIEKAKEVFEWLPFRDIVSWNALIAGYGRREHGRVALNCLEWMHAEGLSADMTTFLCVLTACSHSGLLNEGQTNLIKMNRDYGYEPDPEHFTSMIYLFGHMGLLDKAVTVIEKMSSSNYLPMWVVLLGACRKWGNAELGRWAFERAIRLDAKAAASYICMGDNCVSAGTEEEEMGRNRMCIVQDKG